MWMCKQVCDHASGIVAPGFAQFSKSVHFLFGFYITYVSCYAMQYCPSHVVGGVHSLNPYTIFYYYFGYSWKYEMGLKKNFMTKLILSQPFSHTFFSNWDYFSLFLLYPKMNHCWTYRRREQCSSILTFIYLLRGVNSSRSESCTSLPTASSVLFFYPPFTAHILQGHIGSARPLPGFPTGLAVLS